MGSSVAGCKPLHNRTGQPWLTFHLCSIPFALLSLHYNHSFEYMHIITRKKQNSSFYITLNEERYWFPGDCIRGRVTLHLQKPCKTASIRVCLWGKVTTIIKDRKEEFPLFQKEILAFQMPGGKSTVLEARVHSFPFEFVLPTDLQLPSFTEVRTDQLVLRHEEINQLMLYTFFRMIIPKGLSFMQYRLFTTGHL